MTPFDQFFAIDWSARNRPSPARPTRDAIWMAEGSRRGRIRISYFRTRRAAVDYLSGRLRWLARRNRRVLVGWDFSFGYPRGLAKSLRLRGEAPPWLRIWQHLDELIEDGAENRNNRFGIGARLNQEIGAPSGPFWGVPAGQSGIFLGAKRDFDYPVPTKRGMLAERRRVERHYPRMQPAWKLAYAGSVGGQALLGIPYVYRLRFRDEQLRPVSAVWPFEPLPATGTAIVHAEIYPSLLPRPGRDPIPDREQVRCYLEWMRERQDNQQLAPLLERPWGGGRKRDRRVRRHEGWVLGVTQP